MNTAILGGAGEGGGDPCASCNSGTDANVAGVLETATTSFNIAAHCNTEANDVGAQSFTIAGTRCITGYTFVVNDQAGSPTADFNIQIYTDSSGPSSPVADTLATINMSAIVAYGNKEVLLAATQELAAGNYWMVFWAGATGTLDGSNYIRLYSDPAGTGAYYQDPSDGCPPSSSNWTAIAGDEVFMIEVLGCTP